MSSLHENNYYSRINYSNCDQQSNTTSTNHCIFLSKMTNEGQHLQFFSSKFWRSKTNIWVDIFIRVKIIFAAMWAFCSHVHAS